MCYQLIQPGSTSRQLYETLKKIQSKLWILKNKEMISTHCGSGLSWQLGLKSVQQLVVALDWSSLVFYFHGCFLLASYNGWVPSQSPFHSGAKAFYKSYLGYLTHDLRNTSCFFNFWIFNILTFSNVLIELLNITNSDI